MNLGHIIHTTEHTHTHLAHQQLQDTFRCRCSAVMITHRTGVDRWQQLKSDSGRGHDPDDVIPCLTYRRTGRVLHARLFTSASQVSVIRHVLTLTTYIHTQFHVHTHLQLDLHISSLRPPSSVLFLAWRGGRRQTTEASFTLTAGLKI